jgi:hypothetical protein
MEYQVVDFGFKQEAQLMNLEIENQKTFLSEDGGQ